MDVLQQAKLTIEQRNLADAHTPVLLMVSGGSDSATLAYIAYELRKQEAVGPLAMLHVNHMLRGAAADADAAFVERLANTLEIPLFQARVNVAALVKEEQGNTEAIARRERYALAADALESLCNHVGVSADCGRIFTAHTQDDRVETFYMRSIVGTGPGGFRSMVYQNGCVCRPLLDVSRQDLQDYLVARRNAGASVCEDDQGNLWREDESNQSLDYFRNYVRSEIVPRAKEKNTQLLSTLCRTMNLIADEDDYLAKCADALYSKQVTWLDDATCILSPELGEQDAVLLRRVIMRVLQEMLGYDARVEFAAVQAVCSAYDQGKPVSGYVANIQGDKAVSANKQGVRIEPMGAFRARRKKK